MTRKTISAQSVSPAYSAMKYGQVVAIVTRCKPHCHDYDRTNEVEQASVHIVYQYFHSDYLGRSAERCLDHVVKPLRAETYNPSSMSRNSVTATLATSCGTPPR